MEVNQKLQKLEAIQPRRGKQQRSANLQRQGTLFEFEKDFQKEQNEQENGDINNLQSDFNNQLVSDKAKKSHEHMAVQIDEIFLFYLNQNLSEDIKKIIQIQLQQAHLAQIKVDKINKELEQNNVNFQMISSLYNYVKSLKNYKTEILNQYKSWNDEFPCQILIKNDGNCFYRSFMFKYILEIILSSNKLLLEKLIHEIINLPQFKHGYTDAHQDLQDEEIKSIFIIFLVKNYQRVQNKDMFSIYDFIKDYNSNHALDISLVVLMRNILYQFYMKIKNSHHYQGWIQNFEKSHRHKELVTLGKDAEQNIMVLASQVIYQSYNIYFKILNRQILQFFIQKKAFEVKVFALTFYKLDNGEVTSSINEFYLKQEDYNISIYVLFQNDHYNILLEQGFLNKYKLYFLEYLDVEDSKQTLTYFDMTGQRSRAQSQIFDQDNKNNKNSKDVAATNFFVRLQLEDPNSLLKPHLLNDFGFKKQINVAPQQNQSMIISKMWDLKENEIDQELPLFNPLLMEQEYQVDFKTYLEKNQLSKIDSIMKKEESIDNRDLAHINQEIKPQTQKKVTMSMNIIQSDNNESSIALSSQNNVDTPKQIKSIYKKPTQELIQSERKIQKQLSIEEAHSEKSISSQTSEITNTDILYDKKCLDCDVYTSLPDKIIVMNVYKGIVICNNCVAKKVDIMIQNKLQSIIFYNVQLYRFQLLDLLKDLNHILQRPIESNNQLNQEENKSFQLITKQLASEKLKTQQSSSLENDQEEKCAACQYSKIERSQNLNNTSFFLNIQNYNQSQSLLICKRCFQHYYNDAIQNQYLHLMKIDNTYINPKDVINLYNQQIQDINKSGQLLQCQFYCQLEYSQDKQSYTQKDSIANIMAAQLYDTVENQLLQKKICLPCFQKILQSTMNIDSLVQMSCQIKIFSVIFRQDFLNDVCISCNTGSKDIKNNNFSKGYQQKQNQTGYLFRIIENVEKFDSFVCFSCIKNVLIDQYTSKIQTENEQENQSTKRQFKILYRKIGVIFSFSYSPLINNQILKALQNEAQKNQLCFKCQSKDCKVLYFLNNPDNQSLCQNCFLNILQKFSKSDIVLLLKITESQYHIIKEGVLQNLFSSKICFSCWDQNNSNNNINKNKDLYHIWVKDYARILLICYKCSQLSKVYYQNEIFEIDCFSFKERVLFQFIDIPKDLPQNINEIKENENKISEKQIDNQQSQDAKQQPSQITLHSYQSLSQDQRSIKYCQVCQDKSKKPIQMKNCSCKLCVKCISATCSADNNDFITCPSPYCIQKYQKIDLIIYIDELLKQEIQLNEERKIKQKLARQNKDKYLCNSCNNPENPVVLTKQKFCSCVILCKPCLQKIDERKRCFKCLEEIWISTKPAIEFFDDNQLCPSCLDPLNIQQQIQQLKNDQNNQKNQQKKQIKCQNCLYNIKLII